MERFGAKLLECDRPKDGIGLQCQLIHYKRLPGEPGYEKETAPETQDIGRIKPGGLVVEGMDISDDFKLIMKRDGGFTIPLKPDVGISVKDTDEYNLKEIKVVR